MSLLRADIAGLVPHHGNMCLLDSVESWDETQIVCHAASHADPANPLRDGERLPAVCGIEYAAQAMAVHGGLLARDRGGKPAAGFLASARDVVLHVERLDDIPGMLTVRAEKLAGEGGRMLYQFRISGDGRELLSGRAAVVLTEGKP